MDLFRFASENIYTRISTKHVHGLKANHDEFTLGPRKLRAGTAWQRQG